MQERDAVVRVNRADDAVGERVRESVGITDGVDLIPLPDGVGIAQRKDAHPGAARGAEDREIDLLVPGKQPVELNA